MLRMYRFIISTHFGQDIIITLFIIAILLLALASTFVGQSKAGDGAPPGGSLEAVNIGKYHVNYDYSMFRLLPY